MMKKNGFTLAEVLITLTIIGVVATMTLPALMTNVQEQQARTGLKKGINTLTEAVQMNQAIAGFGYSDLAAEGGTDTLDNILQEQSLRGLLLNRAQIDTRLSNIGIRGAVMPTALSKYLNSANNPIMNTGLCELKNVVSFRDGSALLYDPQIAVATPANTVSQDDGLPLGFLAVYDANGLKGPNRLSNCTGNARAEKDYNYELATPDTKYCNKRADRIIRDQFLVRLRGSSVTPAGAAAKWVMDN